MSYRQGGGHRIGHRQLLPLEVIHQSQAPALGGGKDPFFHLPGAEQLLRPQQFPEPPQFHFGAV